MKKTLKNLLNEVFEEAPKVNKHKVIEGVSRYGAVGKALYGENNLVKIAEELVGIAENAHSHIIGEQGDWFDKITVNKNTYWRRELDADEFKALIRWKQNINHAMWISYSALIGIIIKIIFF